MLSFIESLLVYLIESVCFSFAGQGVQVTVWRSRVLELTGVGCLLAVCFTGSLTLVTGKCTILFLGTHNMYHRCNMF